MDKIGFKKTEKELYLPGKKPALIDVPAIRFIAVDGRGAPAGPQYQAAVQALYSLSFTIKMSRLNGTQPEGYFEYVVPPLEGLWWSEGGRLNWDEPKEKWLWTSLIRQPDFVTPEVFQWAQAQCAAKKPDVDVSRARLLTFAEGLCVQVMHTGPYDEESRSLALIEDFIARNGLADCVGAERKHHEIYLSDPRKTPPERLRTVLRIPVRRAD